MCDKCSDDAEYCGELPVKFDKCCSNCKPAKAVIQTAVVETTDGLKQLCNVVVRVIGNNTIYYVDDKHRIMEVSTGAVTRDNYDFANNPEKFAGQIVFDYANNIAFYYDNSGRAFEIAEDFQGAITAEANARIAADNDLQTEIDNLKNSPDVVDIVDTYADLEAYDTQHLGDNDIVRVLTDETHDGESSYYRWDKHNETWTFIGSINYVYTGGNGIDITDNEVSVKIGKWLNVDDENRLNVDDEPLGTLLFKNIRRFEFSTTDLYDGVDHAYLQGFCYVNGKIIAGLRNNKNQDNYIRLIELDLSNGTIVRQAYLELNHANSITYNEKDDKLYVASCAKMVGGVYTYDDAIFVVDYQTFTLTKTINISNIPTGHRIRSVWYDNATDTLYAGDCFDMFILDEQSETITTTIHLSTLGLDTSATNQTLKKIGDFYYGIFISFLAIWDNNRELVRIINIDKIQDGEDIGEVEDFVFDDNGSIIVGTANYDSPRLPYINASFYTTRLAVNTSTLIKLPGATTTAIDVYVDSNSVIDKEDGTASAPYKSLQRAVNYALFQQKPCTIVVAAGSYEYTYINGVTRLSMLIAGSSTIDGLELLNGRLDIYRNDNSATLTVNGISIRYGALKANFGITVNKMTKTGVIGSGYNIYAYYGDMDITDCVFTGDNSHNLIRGNYNSVLSIRNCSFSNYSGYYAVRLDNNSVAYIYNATLNKTVSASEHHFMMTSGSRLFSDPLLDEKNNYEIEGNAMHYPSQAVITPEHNFRGTLCTVDTHYQYILFKIKLPSTGSDYVEKLVKIKDLDSGIKFTINNFIDSGFALGSIALSYNSSTKVLSISSNKKYWHNISGGADSYSELSNDSPTTPNNWLKIVEMTYLSL